MARAMMLPGRIKAPIKQVKVKKIPYHMEERFKEAIRTEKVDIAIPEGRDPIVYVNKKIEGPLGDFLNNALYRKEAVSGRNVREVAEEAFNDVVNASENVVRAVVDGGVAIVYSASQNLQHEVEYFVVHTIGDPIVHEFDKLGNTIGREADNFVHTVTREAGNFANTVESVVKDVGKVLCQYGCNRSRSDPPCTPLGHQ